jgi:DNA ligase-like protein
MAIVASFYDFVLVAQSLSQTQSRAQMAEAAGTFLASLGIEEAGIAARFMAGMAVEPGEENQLRVSARAIWKIAAELAGAEDEGEEIFAAAENFGDAIEMTLKRRAADPPPTLTLCKVNEKFREIAAIEGRHARARMLEALRGLFERASALEGGYLAKILAGEMRREMSEAVLIEALATMASRPAAEVRRLYSIKGGFARVVRLLRSSGMDKL